MLYQLSYLGAHRCGPGTGPPAEAAGDTGSPPADPEDIVSED